MSAQISQVNERGWKRFPTMPLSRFDLRGKDEVFISVLGDSYARETIRAIRAYAPAGQTCEAARQYRNCETILRRELQITPDPEPGLC